MLSAPEINSMMPAEKPMPSAMPRTSLLEADREDDAEQRHQA
jgi:hypothetical protein